ncbi:MAG: hypothetical protein LBO76_04975, partial [Treponema sp.]|nr:hypothetical protein [Treponema sp.]
MGLMVMTGFFASWIIRITDSTSTITSPTSTRYGIDFLLSAPGVLSGGISRSNCLIRRETNQVISFKIRFSTVASVSASVIGRIPTAKRAGGSISRAAAMR